MGGADNGWVLLRVLVAGCCVPYIGDARGGGCCVRERRHVFATGVSHLALNLSVNDRVRGVCCIIMKERESASQ